MFFELKKNMKLNLLLVSLAIIIISLSNCQESSTDNQDSVFDQVMGIKLKRMEGLEKLLDESDMTHFTYYYKKTSNNSKLGAQLLSNVSRKLAYLANIVMIDCDEIEPKDTPMCEKDPEAKDGYPKMEVYSPPEFKYNPYTKKLNRHTRKMYNTEQVSENLIYNFITQNIPARSLKINTENFEGFVSNLEFNKVLLFTDKAKTPLLFRGLSNYFYDRLMFGEVDKDQTALLKKFKIMRFPTLIIYQSHEDEINLDEPRVEVYDGDIKAESIANFIGQYALREPLTKKIQMAKENPESIKYRVAFKNLNKDDIKKYLQKFSQKRFVIFANDKEDIPEDIKKFNMLTMGFFHFINFNCKADKESEEFCRTNFKIDEIPSLILYKNNEKDMIKSLDKSGISLPFDFSGIEREIYKEFDGHLKEGNPQTFSAMVNEVKINKKVPFIYLHEGEIPLGIYLISSEEKYTKYIDFIVYEHPPKEFIKQLQLTKLPKLVVLLQDSEKPDTARILTYNEELVYYRLANFMNQYFNNERSTKIHEEKVEEKPQDINFIKDNASLDKYCFKGKKLCVLGFLDGRFNKDSQKQFDNSIKVLENVDIETRKRTKPVSFGWVNATCHTEIANNFNINSESLPNLIIYVPSKNLYTSLIGTFDEESINRFIDRVIQGKASMKSVSKDQIKISDTKCEDIKEIIESSEDDELFRELLEEQKQKREQFEKERKELEGKKGKKKKKKKSDL